MVIPVKTGIQGFSDVSWMPASAGMTNYYCKSIMR